MDGHHDHSNHPHPQIPLFLSRAHTENTPHITTTPLLVDSHIVRLYFRQNEKELGENSLLHRHFRSSMLPLW
jgi:hypothetical protein